jgi:hypothetical protein
MELQSKRTNHDFSQMEWRNSRLYSVSFPDEEFRLGFDIDYIFESSEAGFLVGPCDLQFDDVANLKIDANFAMNMLIFVNEIRRTGPQKSPNGAVDMWQFEIECDNATFTFTASGYEMKLRNSPTLSETSDIGR